MASTNEPIALPLFANLNARRSRNMAAIKSKDTKPELFARSALHKAGFRFVLRPGNLPGRTDVILPRYLHVVFVNGCFWHGHGCKISHTPKSNSDYWTGSEHARVRIVDYRNLHRNVRNFGARGSLLKLTK